MRRAQCRLGPRQIALRHGHFDPRFGDGFGDAGRADCRMRRRIARKMPHPRAAKRNIPVAPDAARAGAMHRLGNRCRMRFGRKDDDFINRKRRMTQKRLRIFEPQIAGKLSGYRPGRAIEIRMRRIKRNFRRRKR